MMNICLANELLNLKVKHEKITTTADCPRHTKDDSLEMTHTFPLPRTRSIPMLIYNSQVLNSC